MQNLKGLRQQRQQVSANQSHRKGAALMECAVMLPVLMIMVLGVLEIGSALRASTILQSACREAGRLTAMDWRYITHDDQTPNEKVIQDLKNFVTAAGLRGNDSTVTITHADGANAGQTFDLADTDNDLQFVKVEVTLPYSSVSLFPLTYLAGKTLKANVIMRATTGRGGLSE